MSPLFEKRYDDRGFDVYCQTSSLKYFTNKLKYRAINCHRYNYHNDKKLDDGYAIEDNRGVIRTYSKKHFIKI